MRIQQSVLVATMACFIAGCSSDGGTDYLELYKFAKKAFDQNRGDNNVTLDQAASVPYATIGVRIAGGPENMLVLASQAGSDYYWTSQDHLVLVTRDGRVVHVAGLGAGFSELSSQDAGNSTLLPTGIGAGRTEHLLADFASLRRYSVPITCTLAQNGNGTISILGNQVQTALVKEKCDCPMLNWSFENRYWIDPETKMVLRSVQNLGPQIGVVEIEVLRPPA